MFTAESRHVILTQTLALSRGRESWREQRPRGATARQKLGRPVHAVTELLCIDNKCKIRSKMHAPSHLDTIHMLLKPSGTSDEINIDLQKNELEFLPSHDFRRSPWPRLSQGNVQQLTIFNENEDDFFAMKQQQQLEHQSLQEKQYFVHTGPRSEVANVDHHTDAMPEPLGSQFFPLLLSHSVLPSSSVFNSAELMASPQLSDRQFKPRCMPGFMNSSTVHFDMFPVWEQQGAIIPQTALSSYSNFMHMGAESTEYSTKTCDSECAYDFLSPRALHRSKFAEDGDPKQLLTGVFDERFLSPDLSSKPSTESQITAALVINPIQEIYFQEAIEERNMMPDLDATVPDVNSEQMPTLSATPSNRLYSSVEFHPPRPGSLAAQKPVKKKDQIFEALKYEMLTEKEIHLRCGMSQHVRCLLRELLRDGLIVRAGQGGYADPFRYRANRAHYNIQ